MIVRSAVISMLNTSQFPRRRIAATILPSTLVPMGRPNASPSVARTEGAVKNTTFFAGSSSADCTSAMLGCTVSAPTGHATTHWPQPTQEEYFSSVPPALPTWAANPLPMGPIAPTCCFLHAATQRMQLMHLSLSRITQGLDSSRGVLSGSPAKRSSSAPYSAERRCNSQLLFRSQERHFFLCLESRSSRETFLLFLHLAVFVCTSMPSATG